MTQTHDTFKNLTETQIEEIIAQVEASKPWSGGLRGVELFLLKWYSRVIFTFIGFTFYLSMNQLGYNVSFLINIIFIIIDIYFFFNPPIVEKLSIREFCKQFLYMKLKSEKTNLYLKYFLSFIWISGIALSFCDDKIALFYLFFVTIIHIFVTKLFSIGFIVDLYKNFTQSVALYAKETLAFSFGTICCLFFIIPLYAIFLNSLFESMAIEKDVFLKIVWVIAKPLIIFQFPSSLSEIYSIVKARLIMQTIDNYFNKRNLNHDR